MNDHDPYFPFHTLGFRCNPFRVLTEEEWVQVAVLPKTLKEVLKSDFHHIQVLGEEGRGKTTTLQAIKAYLTRFHKRWVYEYLPHGQNSFHTDVRELDVFLLDEFQRLNRRHRNRLLKAITTGPGGISQLIFTSHVDVTPLFVRRNLPLISIQLEGYDPNHLRKILDQRMAYFALSEIPKVTITKEAVLALWEEYGTDLRAMEFFLYKVFQSLEKEREITAVQLHTMIRRIKTDEERG